MEYSVKINGQMATDQAGGEESRRKNNTEEMRDSLQKLNGLSKDDKTESAMLRSRIDEQSQLIMILKQRADDAVGRTQTLENIVKELTDFRDNAKEQINHEIRKFNLLDGRFNDLASNHEEMIKFKDEYKRVNVELRAENEKLRDDNAKLFSKAILEKDEKIASLERQLMSSRDKQDQVDAKYRQALQETRQREEGLRQEIQTLQEKYRADVKTLQAKLADTEERLKGANYKLQNLTDSHQNADTETQTRIQQLTKEKDELLDLAMQRGKIVHKEQNENKRLMKKIAEMEKSVKNMEEKFEREAAAVNSNRQVKQLRDQLEETDLQCTEVTKEFDVYKKYTNGLLKKERELNERLRHLVG